MRKITSYLALVIFTLLFSFRAWHLAAVVLISVALGVIAGSLLPLKFLFMANAYLILCKLIIICCVPSEEIRKNQIPKIFLLLVPLTLASLASLMTALFRILT